MDRALKILAFATAAIFAGVYAMAWWEERQANAEARDTALGQEAPTPEQVALAADYIDTRVADLVQPGPGDRWTVKSLYGMETAIVRAEERTVICSFGSIEIEFSADVSVSVFFMPDEPSDRWPGIHPAFWHGPAGKTMFAAMCRRTEERLAEMAPGRAVDTTGLKRAD